MQRTSRKSFSNDDAQAAIIFLLVVGLVAVGALYILTMPVMEDFNIFHNNATQGSSAFIPLSQERQDAVFILQVAYNAYPIIAFLILIVASVIAALRWRAGTA